MKQFWSICIYLFACSYANAQVGDSLYEEGDYRAAAVAFEYEYFTGGRENYELLYRKAMCYKELEEYEHALSILDRITSVNDNGGVSAQQLQYERIVLAYLIKDYPKAHAEILKYELKFGAADSHVNVFKFLTLLSLGRMGEADEVLLTLQDQGEITSQDRERLAASNWKLKDPQKAYNLSLFLPGVGQMYAGHFGRGLVSGGVQLALVGFTAWHLYHGYFFTGGMTGAAFFYTFYLGGARHARDLSNRRNEKLKASIKKEFLNQTLSK
ncbi:tetratricopeptide repeat protein [Marinoscillum furvescens]|uniref:Tetratricopeptide repeat protein n=1 Tax=Marinoscillum furvescens DSM 4134 TaxID=1122208 RepID=A0A3D9KYB8_MARFU|nr:tetratricopeptide repeat protein [Marinoscillum furvescens]RED93364.1 tetratricopeptide repeat protein [Marinoscillum furvescens DSM 4134]